MTLSSITLAGPTKALGNALASSGIQFADYRGMAGIRDYRDFDAWKLANEVRVSIHRITKRAEFREHLWLRAQLRRAANSSCVNTGEGFSRFWPRDFARFLDIAKGSLTEIIEHMPDVVAFDLATSEEADEISSFARRSRGAVTGLIRYLRSIDPREDPTRQVERRPPQRKQRKSPEAC